MVVGGADGVVGRGAGEREGVTAGLTVGLTVGEPVGAGVFVGSTGAVLIGGAGGTG